MGQLDSSLPCVRNTDSEPSHLLTMFIFKDPTGPGVNNPTGIVPIVSDQTWARGRFGTQQAPVCIHAPSFPGYFAEV